jgi:hypothetical protein
MLAVMRLVIEAHGTNGQDGRVRPPQPRRPRIVPLGEQHLRKTLHEFATHYHRERSHQGLANELIDRPAAQRPTGVIHRRQRVGGILSYYYRSAA